MAVRVFASSSSCVVSSVVSRVGVSVSLLSASLSVSRPSSSLSVPSSSSSSSSSSFRSVLRLKPVSSVSFSTSSISSSSQSSSTSTPSSSGVEPFHLAFPVHDLGAAREFYGQKLGLEEGRSSHKWIDYSLFGHQIVCHLISKEFKAVDYFNPVDGDEVPVPHFGVVLTVPQFHEFAARVKKAGIKFIIEPHLRFQGKPGEQWTMFFKDPSNNNLEFKAMTNPKNLFAKYFVN